MYVALELAVLYSMAILHIKFCFDKHSGEGITSVSGFWLAV